MSNPNKKKQVRFTSCTKMHDGLNPLSLLVESIVVHILNNQLQTKHEFVQFVCNAIFKNQLNVDYSLQYVYSHIQDIIVRIYKQYRVNTSKGVPILMHGGGKGYYLPIECVPLLRKMVFWIGQINVDQHFTLEISV